MRERENWWESFFEGLWLEFQLEKGLDPGAADEARRIAETLGLRAGEDVLDAPCGEGRIARELAALGCNVTGVDLSKAALAEGVRRAAVRGVHVQFERNDLRRLPYEREFDAVVCHWGSFGYFDDVGNLEQLRCAARALRPGGRMFVDGHVTETLFPKFAREGRDVRGDIEFTERRRWDALAGRVDVEWELVRGERRETRHTSIRIYSTRELVHLARQAGFDEAEVVAVPGGGPLAVGSDRCAMIARRAGG